jgi:hypothetical protein
MISIGCQNSPILVDTVTNKPVIIKRHFISVRFNDYTPGTERSPSERMTCDFLTVYIMNICLTLNI